MPAAAHSQEPSFTPLYSSLTAVIAPFFLATWACENLMGITIPCTNTLLALFQIQVSRRGASGVRWCLDQPDTDTLKQHIYSITLNINNMQNKPLQNLSTSDLQFCRVLTGQYKQSKGFLEQLSIETYDRMKSHVKSDKGVDVNVFLNIISNSNLIGYYSNLILQLRKNYIKQLEDFLALKYRITFDSFATTATPDEFARLESFEPVIENITCQLGNDFRKAGVDYLLEELRNMLILKRKPQLDDCRMIFQESFSYDLADGKQPFLTSARNILLITKAIAIYLTGNRELYREVENRFSGWEDHFHFNRSYVIANTVSVKFASDKCFQLTFPDNVNAALFYFQFMIGDGL
jgi:hypothetical protein